MTATDPAPASITPTTHTTPKRLMCEPFLRAEVSRSMESLTYSRHMNVTPARDQVPKASTPSQTSGTRGRGRESEKRAPSEPGPVQLNALPRPKAAQELEGLVQHGPAPRRVDGSRVGPRHAREGQDAVPKEEPVPAQPLGRQCNSDDPLRLGQCPGPGGTGRTSIQSSPDLRPGGPLALYGSDEQEFETASP